jgi:prefoldin subunit 5
MSSNITLEALANEIKILKAEINNLKEETKSIARNEVEYHKNIIKNDLRDELRKELASKDDVLLVKKEVEMIRTELKGEIDLVRGEMELLRREMEILKREMIIMTLIIILAMYAPDILGKIGILFK